MKNLKTLIAAAMLVVSASASAQFTNESSPRVNRTSSEVPEWNSFWVQYNPSKIKIDAEGSDDVSLNAFSIGYSRGIALSKSIPFFIEVGLGLQYYFKTESQMETYAEMFDLSESELGKLMDPKQKYSMFSAKIPVNLTYVFAIPNSSVSIAPYLGLTARFSFSATSKQEYNLTSDFRKYLKDEGYGDKEINEVYGNKDVNLFDKKDMGSNEATWKRFQLGWQIGLNVRFNHKFYLGASYGTDFSEIAKKSKMQTTSIMLGFCF